MVLLVSLYVNRVKVKIKKLLTIFKSVSCYCLYYPYFVVELMYASQIIVTSGPIPFETDSSQYSFHAKKMHKRGCERTSLCVTRFSLRNLSKVVVELVGVGEKIDTAYYCNIFAW